MDRKANKPRYGSEPPVDCPRREPNGAAGSEWDHVVVLAFERSGPAMGEVTKKGLGVDRAKLDALGSQPAGEVEEVEGVGPDGRGRITAIGQIGEVVIAQLEIFELRPLAGDLPSSAGSAHLQCACHGT